MCQIAEPKELRDKGYKFSNEYSIIEEMIEIRYTGYLMNGNGEIFADLDGNSVEESITPYAVLNKRVVPTDNTKIVYGIYYNGSFKSKQEIQFHDYCLGISAGEARQAVDIAIKTYTWHYKIIPIDSVNGVDIGNEMQAYLPDKVSKNSAITTDYNTVKNIWMESYGGAIFEALYKVGSYNDDRSTYPGERVQNGCRYLINELGMNLYECIHYYYDNT